MQNTGCSGCLSIFVLTIMVIFGSIFYSVNNTETNTAVSATTVNSETTYTSAKSLLPVPVQVPQSMQPTNTSTKPLLPYDLTPEEYSMIGYPYCYYEQAKKVDNVIWERVETEIKKGLQNNDILFNVSERRYYYETLDEGYSLLKGTFACIGSSSTAQRVYGIFPRTENHYYTAYINRTTYSVDRLSINDILVYDHLYGKGEGDENIQLTKDSQTYKTDLNASATYRLYMPALSSQTYKTELNALNNTKVQTDKTENNIKIEQEPEPLSETTDTIMPIEEPLNIFETEPNIGTGRICVPGVAESADFKTEPNIETDTTISSIIESYEEVSPKQDTKQKWTKMGQKRRDSRKWKRERRLERRRRQQ